MAGLYDEALLARLRKGAVATAAGWGLSPRTDVRLLTISENATFLADDPDTGRRVVLRVHRPDYHRREEILSELAWIEALRAERVLDTPAPLRRTDGALLGVFQDGGRARHVAAFEHAPGAAPDESGDLRLAFERLGAVSARLHGHARRWSAPRGFHRKRWDFDAMLGRAMLWGDFRAAAGLTRDGRRTLERAAVALRAALAAYGLSRARFGLAHADLRLANLLQHGERLTVIDFDDCGFTWLIYDFAAAVSFIETRPDIPELADAWAEGYATVVPLPAADRAMIPGFVLLRRMLLTAWLASHPETPTASELGEGFAEGTVAMAEAWMVGRRDRGPGG